ncbi:hypothetical protein Peur_047590 [Populus x canadensis]
MNFASGSVSLLLRRRDALKHKVFMQVCIFLLLPAKEILDLAQIMRKARMDCPVSPVFDSCISVPVLFW